MSGSARSPEKPAARTPGEVRAYEKSVWDLTRNLIHPAFLYVVFQVALWCGLERYPAFSQMAFWKRTAIHALQFLGAWGVFYGTLLRDMRFQTWVVTVVLWLAAAGAALVWLVPVTPNAAGVNGVLVVELAAGVAGWALTMATWRRAKARHAAGEGGPSVG